MQFLADFAQRVFADAHQLAARLIGLAPAFHRVFVKAQQFGARRLLAAQIMKDREQPVTEHRRAGQANLERQQRTILAPVLGEKAHAARAMRRSDTRGHAVCRFGNLQFRRRDANQFVAAVAGQPAIGVIHLEDAAGEIGHPEALAGRFQHRAVFLLAARQGRLRHLALADRGVGADHAQRGAGGIACHHRRPVVDPHPTAVAVTQAVLGFIACRLAIEMRLHRRQDSRAIIGMDALLPIGDGARDILLAVAEDGAPAVVAQHAPALHVAIPDAQPRATQCEIQLLLTIAQGLLGAPPLADIDESGDGRLEPAALVVEDRHRVDAQPAQLAGWQRNTEDLVAQRFAAGQRAHRRVLAARQRRAVLAYRTPARVERGQPEQLVMRQPEQPLGRRIGVDDAAAHILRDDAFGHRRKDAVQLRIAEPGVRHSRSQATSKTFISHSFTIALLPCATCEKSNVY